MWFNKEKTVKSFNILRLDRLENCFQFKGILKPIVLRCPFPISLTKDEERQIANQMETHAQKLLVDAIGAQNMPVLLSRSNTRSEEKGEVVVVAAVHDGTLSGVGIDIEYRERPTVSQLINRITQNEEREIPLTALKFFCVKEACFKAGGDLPASLKTITQIETNSYDVESRKGTASTKDHFFEFSVEDEDSLVVAFAIRRSV